MSKRCLLRAVAWAAVACVAGCEDGPQQVFEEFQEESTAPQNGLDESDPWAVDGGRGYDSESGGDSVGRARFCDEAESTALIQDMVSAPIVPDESLGGISLWGKDDRPIIVDSLLGHPDDGGFCEPTYIGDNYYIWGPTADVGVLFDPETRQVTSLLAFNQYLGALSGSYQDADGQEVKVSFRILQRARVDGAELDKFATPDEQADQPNSWLNHANVNKMYRMLRATFFADQEQPEPDYDCVKGRICDIVYIGQESAIAFQDSGVAVEFAPTGEVQRMFIDPVRVAPFEAVGELDFGVGAPGAPPAPADPGGEDPGGDDPGTEDPGEEEPAPEAVALAPTFASGRFDACAFDLSQDVTWKAFLERCVPDEVTLNRANYNVYAARDEVRVEFNGINLNFLRQPDAPLLRDGQQPDEGDTLQSITFTRGLNAPVAQFVPAVLAAHYKQRLEARVAQAVSPAAGEDHPMLGFQVSIPEGLSADPQRIDKLTYVDARGGEVSWVDEVLASLTATYNQLTPAQRELVDPAVLDPVFVLKPFVDAIMSVFSGGATDAPEAFKGFATTDAKRWVVGYGHFFNEGQPYRLVAQYSLNFGALTAVTVARGFGGVDDLINVANEKGRALVGDYPMVGQSPYYAHVLSSGVWEQVAGPDYLVENPLALGAASMRVTGADRQLDTLQVEVDVGEETRMLTVSGRHIDDGAGFSRQINGERFEFVHAHRVNLYGKETQLVVYLDEAGTVARVDQLTFKGGAFLCGLGGPQVHFGQDVRAVMDYYAQVDPEGYRACEVVFNYSENGNVLNSVASVKNKVSVTVDGGLAVSVSNWK